MRGRGHEKWWVDIVNLWFPTPTLTLSTATQDTVVEHTHTMKLKIAGTNTHSLYFSLTMVFVLAALMK